MRDDELHSDASELFFHSQSLHHDRPDHVQVGGERVDGTLQRRELAQNINEVSRSGRRLQDYQCCHSSESGVVAPVFYNDRFTLRIRVEELDDAGRETAIVCYGRMPRESSMDWVCRAMTETQAFADRIGRTISCDTRKEMRKSFETLLKTHGSLRNSLKRLLRRFVVLALRWIRRIGVTK